MFFFDLHAEKKKKTFLFSDGSKGDISPKMVQEVVATDKEKYVPSDHNQN